MLTALRNDWCSSRPNKVPVRNARSNKTTKLTTSRKLFAFAIAAFRHLLMLTLQPPVPPQHVGGSHSQLKLTGVQHCAAALYTTRYAILLLYYSPLTLRRRNSVKSSLTVLFQLGRIVCAYDVKEAFAHSCMWLSDERTNVSLSVIYYILVTFAGYRI